MDHKSHQDILAQLVDLPELHTIFEPYEQQYKQQVAVTVLMPVYNERHLVAASLARVLAIDSALIARLEVIVVDDCSTDGSFKLLQQIAQKDCRVKLIRHEKNQGKGSAIRTALEYATWDICIVHDADMEYNPADIPALLVPFIEEGADAVYGSRYISAPYRRALSYRHTLTNKALITLTNWITDLDLTDVETCYKAINTTLLKSIPLQSNDFRFEIDITMKLAKRRARIFEVPIRYLPRSYDEGKKIKPKDGLLALYAMLKYSLIDDIYRKDEYGSNILNDLQHARHFNKWMGDTLRPYLGDRILEIGAGIGNLTSQFIPREFYMASDINPHYLHYLRAFSIGKPYLRILEVDANKPGDFVTLKNQFDTVLMINVLEHVPDEQIALRNLYSALQPGGKAVILVPQHPFLYNTLDKVLEHRERYTPEKLRDSLHQAGFRVEKTFDFNRISVPSWFINGTLMKKKNFSRVQLKMLEIMMPVIRRIDRLFPWTGVSIIGIAVKD